MNKLKTFFNEMKNQIKKTENVIEFKNRSEETDEKSIFNICQYIPNTTCLYRRGPALAY